MNSNPTLNLTRTSLIHLIESYYTFWLNLPPPHKHIFNQRSLTPYLYTIDLVIEELFLTRASCLSPRNPSAFPRLFSNWDRRLRLKPLSSSKSPQLWTKPSPISENGEPIISTQGSRLRPSHPQALTPPTLYALEMSNKLVQGLREIWTFLFRKE